MSIQDARICCLWHYVEIPDLKLSMTRGDVKILDATVAKKSRDLIEVLRKGFVSVRYIPKPRIEPAARPQPSPPWLRRPLPQTTPSTAQEPEQRIPEKEFFESLRLVVGQEVDSRLGEVVEAIKKMSFQNPPLAPTPQGNPDFEQEDEDVPVFIPSNLVGKADRVDLEEGEESAADLESAQKALKSLKRKSHDG